MAKKANGGVWRLNSYSEQLVRSESYRSGGTWNIMPSFTSHQKPVPAVLGENTAGGDGLFGKSDNGGRGVAGFSDTWQGVYGHSVLNAGVVGESDQFDGVFGVSHNNQFSGVSGHNDGGYGVWGGSNSGRGVAGFSTTWQGVYGHSVLNAGVVGESDQFDGVFGVSHNPRSAGISGHNPNGLAGYFDGNITVTGDIQIPGADCAEHFETSCPEAIEPGMVMVIDDAGALKPCQLPYDRRVAGVISGAGDLRPAIILDKHMDPCTRRPLALIGKVNCQVDASHASIEVGDLLTTSTRTGHAMKADDQHRAFGAVLGKALRPLQTGQGLIPILVALQ
jgi:hypothetical protein